MTLSELKQIKESLKECNPNVEDFSWGPSLTFAEKRKEFSLNIIEREIKRLKKDEDEEND